MINMVQCTVHWKDIIIILLLYCISNLFFILVVASPNFGFQGGLGWHCIGNFGLAISIGVVGQDVAEKKFMGEGGRIAAPVHKL